MGWPKLWVFVRHGRSEGNDLSKDERARLTYPTFEYRLTELGRRQAEITGEYLRENFGGFDRYYISTYRRTRETLEIMYPGVVPRVDSRLDEVDRGIENVLTQAEIAEQFPFEIERRRMFGRYRYRPLGGESWAEVEHSRVTPICHHVTRKYGGKRLLFVGHGTWFVIFGGKIHHRSIAETELEYEHRHPENASVTVYEGVERDGKSILELKAYNIIPWEGKI